MMSDLKDEIVVTVEEKFIVYGYGTILNTPENRTMVADLRELSQEEIREQYGEKFGLYYKPNFNFLCEEDSSEILYFPKENETTESHIDHQFISNWVIWFAQVMGSKSAHFEFRDERECSKDGEIDESLVSKGCLKLVRNKEEDLVELLPCMEYFCEPKFGHFCGDHPNGCPLCEDGKAPYDLSDIKVKLLFGRSKNVKKIKNKRIKI